MYHGRSDDILSAGGFRVSPIEVEAAMLRHPGIDEAAAVDRAIARGDDVGPLAGKTLTHFYSVSWEGSVPTWTGSFEEDFSDYPEVAQETYPKYEDAFEVSWTIWRELHQISSTDRNVWDKLMRLLRRGEK